MRTNVLSVLLLVVTGALVQCDCRAEMQSCNLSRIDQGVSVPALVGVMSDLTFRRPKGFSELNFTFTNTTERSIKALLANLDLLDEIGHRTMTVPVNMTIKAGRIHQPWPIRLSGLQEYVVKNTIGPKASGLVYGYSPRSTQRCPSSAILSYFKVIYTDGKSFELHLPDWYSDSVPYRVPENPTSALKDRVFQAWIKATVGSDGRVRPNASDGLRPDESRYLKEIMRSWIFLPAIRSGRPTQSVALMFVSHGSCVDVAGSPHDAQEGPWISINICPRKDLPVEEIYVGGFLQ